MNHAREVSLTTMRTCVPPIERLPIAVFSEV
jgi:hypothetical protein